MNFRGEKARASFFLLISAPLALISAFVNFITHSGYPLFRSEIFLCVLVLTGIGLLCGSLMLFGHRLTKALVMAVVGVMFLDLVFEFWAWRPYLLLFVGIAGFGICWMLAEHLGTIAAVLFGTLLVLVLLTPRGAIEKPPVTSQPVNTALPMILHIIFDGHIGIAAIPTDVPGAKRVRSVIRGFYRTYDLALYEKAYSHFFNTQDSIPNLLNFSAEPKEVFYFGSFHSGDRLKQNLFFKNAVDKGYRISVHQTDYIDFCAPDGIEIDTCRTFAGVTSRGIDKTPLAPTQKATIIASQFVELSYIYTTVRKVYKSIIQPAIRSMGISIPSWGWERRMVFPITGIDALGELHHEILNSPRGVLHFAHIGLPHEPYVYDRNCGLRPQVSDWLDRSDPVPDSARYEQYLEQVECTYKKLDELFSALSAKGLLDDALIILTSDHGPRITNWSPKAVNRDNLSELDYLSSFSALFAVSQSEAMDECPSDHVDSVHALFRSLFLRPQENESKGDYAFVYLYTDGDDMVKEPFVGYGEFEVGLSSKLQDSCEKRAHETAIN